MGHNESKTTPNFKISQVKSNSNIKNVENKQSSSNTSNASAVTLKEEGIYHNPNTNPNRFSNNESGIFSDKIKNDKHSLSRSEKSDLINQPQLYNFENTPITKTANRLEVDQGILADELAVFPRSYSKIQPKRQLALTPSNQSLGQQEDKQSIPFSAAQQQEEKDENIPLIPVLYPKNQPQEQNVDKQPNLFSTTEPQDKKGGVHSYLSPTFHSEGKNDRKQSALLPSIEPEIKRDENQLVLTSSSQLLGQKDDEPPFLSSKAHSHGMKDKIQPVVLPTSQPPEHNFEEQSLLLFTIEPEGQKVDNVCRPIPFVTSEPHGKNDEPVQFIMTKPKLQKHDNQHVTFLTSQPLVQNNKQPVVFSKKLEKGEEHENPHVAFLTGQPLLKMSDVSNQPKNQIDCHPFTHSTDQPLHTESVTENKPLKKTISSGNPFLQSATNEVMARDNLERNNINDESFVHPNRKDSFDHLHELKKAECTSVVDPREALNLYPTKVKNVSLRKNYNLAAKAVKNKNRTLKVIGPNDSTKSEMVKTLKHFEMIAESLTSSVDKNQYQQVSFRTNSIDPQNKERYTTGTLNNCIMRMKNIKESDKDFSLQNDLVLHLKEMALFTSVLKTCPVVNSDIYSICETIKENLCIVKTNYEIKNMQRSVSASSALKVGVYKHHENQSTTYSLKGNQIIDIAHADHDKTNKFAASSENNKIPEPTSGKKNDENQTNTSQQNLLMALMDQLPSDLTNEIENICLRNNQLYCKVCKTHFTLISNLIQHLHEKNHSALAVGKTTSTSVSRLEISQLSHQTDTSLPSKPAFTLTSAECWSKVYEPLQKKEALVDINQLTQYKSVLDLITNSVNEGFSIDIELFICLLCDYLGNDAEAARTHVETNHKDQQNLFWHFCETCQINIYGTNFHFNDHCLTTQHIDIAKSKMSSLEETSKISSLEEMSKMSSLDEMSKEIGTPDTISLVEELDRRSVCSSKSDTSNNSRSRMKPHEILLAIAKDKRDKNIIGPFGSYCQVCRKYFSGSINLSDHLDTKVHKQFSAKQTFRKKMSIMECSTCQIYLFGDIGVWKEHQNLQVHKELLVSASEEKTKCSKLKELTPHDEGDTRKHNPLRDDSFASFETHPPEANSPEQCSSDDFETNDSEKLSSLNESGPHYDLMKKVLKSNLEKKPDNVFYGFFCHFCQLYFLDQEQWESHIFSSFHSSKLSSKIPPRRFLHDCEVCNIQLVCSNNFFSLHTQSLAHKAISRIPGRREITKESESEEEYSEDEYDSSEDNNESEEKLKSKDDKKGNSSNTNSREGWNKRSICVPNGIYLQGLPKNSVSKDVAEFFKMFGPVQSCIINKNRATGNIVFKDKITATLVVEKKTIEINGTPVMVKPLMTSTPIVKEHHVLHPDVERVLSSRNMVRAAVLELLNEMDRNYISNQQKGNEIKRDLSGAIPGCRVLFFGSQVTGLATGKSDFDIYIDYDGKSFYKDMNYDQQHKIIQHLQYVLKQRNSKFVVKETILEARVPIIRVVHMKTNTPCDISCRSGLSVENSQLVRLYLEMDPRVRWLVVAVRYWMETNGLLDRNAFTSYATVWLVLFFLMRVASPVICPVVVLQKECKPHTVARWDCRFHRDMKDIQRLFRTFNQRSELELLSHFFHMYSTCQFKGTVMCPLNGLLLTRKQFETCRLPREFIPYIDKLQFAKGAERLRIQTPICLQDPFDLSHNITKGVSRIDLRKFKILCKLSYEKCQYLLTR